MKKQSPEVYVPDEFPIALNREALNTIINQALVNESGKCRILLHESPDKNLQQMLIVQKKHNYIRPHIKQESEKYYCVLYGEMLAVTFDYMGNIVSKTMLGVTDSAKAFVYRVDRNNFHTFIPLTDAVAYLETVSGPFVETEFAKWAPSPDEPELVSVYMEKLLSK